MFLRSIRRVTLIRRLFTSKPTRLRGVIKTRLVVMRQWFRRDRRGVKLNLKECFLLLTLLTVRVTARVISAVVRLTFRTLRSREAGNVYCREPL